MNKEGLQKITYGLYLINTKNSGCIINTLMQITNDKIAVTINKENYTNKMLKNIKNSI